MSFFFDFAVLQRLVNIVFGDKLYRLVNFINKPTSIDNIQIVISLIESMVLAKRNSC